MKSFKEYLNEEMLPYAQTEKGFVGVDNGPVRDNINIHLASITAKPYATPYHAMEMVRKVLAPFSIFPPSTNFLDGDSGHEIFEINQFGNKMGMTNDGTVVIKDADPFFVYFEYAMNDKGSFDIFSEIVTEDELDEILADIEADMEEGDTTTGDGEDAEDSFDEYKSDNQLKEETINELSGDKVDGFLKYVKYGKKRPMRKMAIKMAKDKLLKKDGFTKGSAKIAATEETLSEGRPSQRHPLEGHDYHKKKDSELLYIAKDAHKAAEAMKGHNTEKENKYRDQANDSATVRYWRKRNGMPKWYAKKYGHDKE
jgi:hypothetical protein